MAQALSRQGKGWFEQRLGPDVDLQWFTYNAGPSAMEAILAGSLDLTFVGPSPAINAYARSGGAEIRIVSGAANGGSGAGRAAGSESQGAGRFPREENRHAPAWEYPGYFLPRLADRGRA